MAFKQLFLEKKNTIVSESPSRLLG